jgi:hypothetical protein
METLAQLDAFSAQDFKGWLDRCLRQQYDVDLEVRYRACDFRGLGVSRGESDIDDMHRLFDKLSSSAQESFREGMCLLLKHSEPATFPLKAMESLIVLVAVLQVRKALDLFLPVFGDGRWGMVCLGVSLSAALSFNPPPPVLKDLKRKCAEYALY